MIRFYFHPTPNPAKIALLPRRGRAALRGGPRRHQQGRAAHARLPRDQPERQGAGDRRHERPGRQGSARLQFHAILLYLAEKTGKFLGTPEDRPELLSWLLFIASGLGPFSGQAVHFQFAAPEGLGYAVNRYRREAERHYQVLNDHLAGRDVHRRRAYTIADMSAWGWLDRASRVLKGAEDPLAAYPNLKRFFQTIDARPAVARARAVGKDHEFKKVSDEETKRALFPSNYPPAA